MILRKSGLSFASLGAMKLLFLPWVCKPIYAPVVETKRSQAWWVVFSMASMCLTCLLAAFTSEQMLLHLSSVLLILNLASATQDISVDSLAIRILDANELGAGNTIQVVAYKTGSVLVGASLLWIRDLIGWSAMWIIFSLLYLLCILLVVTLNLVPSQERTREISSENLIRDSLKNVFRVKGTRWMVIFVLFYKLCERGEGTLPVYLVDKGVPMGKLGFWTGFVRSAASLGGSTLGGYLLSTLKSSPRSLLIRTAALRCFPITIQLLIINVWGTKPIASSDDLDRISFDSFMFYMAIISLCLANFCAGLLTTACFTAMMTLSQSAPDCVQSTHYSMLATMEVLGKLAFASVSGWWIDSWGLDSVFLLFLILSVLTIPLLWVMPEDLTAQKKKESDQKEY